ncbi:helix-turn-helix transcriptional regulator [Trueperella pyogenes]|uniref:helix-turn-helix transcriptional regulator n=1 Tax=Trueperella pyogenes TaxID=1661 RepID=UPI003DA949F9
MCSLVPRFVKSEECFRLVEVRRWLVSEYATVLKSARKSYGLTQQEVADLAGVSDRTVRALEQGSQSPSLKALFAVAGVLGVEITARRK